MNLEWKECCLMALIQLKNEIFIQCGDLSELGAYKSHLKYKSY